MKKHISMPGFLTDYNSIRNPILSAVVTKIRPKPDKSQVRGRPIGVRLTEQKSGEMIEVETLKKYGATEVSVARDEVIFRSSEEALNYFQVLEGSVKMITDTPDGKEFIQGIFKAKDSFGEPPLICSFPYPSAAIALEPTRLIKLSRQKFLTLLRENFEIHLQLDRVLCERLKYKSMVLSEISSYDPEHRITSLLAYLKGGADRVAVSTKDCRHDFIVPFTRQQIADMTGLRVETVIRSVKKMEHDGKLKVVRRKIAF